MLSLIRTLQTMSQKIKGRIEYPLTYWAPSQIINRQFILRRGVISNVMDQFQMTLQNVQSVKRATISMTGQRTQPKGTLIFRSSMTFCVSSQIRNSDKWPVARGKRTNMRPFNNWIKGWAQRTRGNFEHRTGTQIIRVYQSHTTSLEPNQLLPYQTRPDQSQLFLKVSPPLQAMQSSSFEITWIFFAFASALKSHAFYFAFASAL